MPSKELFESKTTKWSLSIVFKLVLMNLILIKVANDDHPRRTLHNFYAKDTIKFILSIEGAQQ